NLPVKPERPIALHEAIRSREALRYSRRVFVIGCDGLAGRVRAKTALVCGRMLRKDRLTC
ncbi:MAG: hypothetical protein KA139_09555, partial [Rhodobacteraceae bacterium]|nr:hypothetical protein [Paracoccaceae bacterium]